MKRINIDDVESYFDLGNESFRVEDDNNNADVYKPRHILDYLRELRSDGIDSDVTIEVGETSYALHKIFLRRSQYFSNLFDEFGEQKSFNLDVFAKVSLYRAAKYLLIVELVDHYVMAHATGLTKLLLLERFHASHSVDRIINEEAEEEEAEEEVSASNDDKETSEPQRVRKFDEQLFYSCLELMRYLCIDESGDDALAETMERSPNLWQPLRIIGDEWVKMILAQPYLTSKARYHFVLKTLRMRNNCEAFNDQQLPLEADVSLFDLLDTNLLCYPLELEWIGTFLPESVRQKNTAFVESFQSNWHVSPASESSLSQLQPTSAYFGICLKSVDDEVFEVKKIFGLKMYFQCASSSGAYWWNLCVQNALNGPLEVTVIWRQKSAAIDSWHPSHNDAHSWKVTRVLPSLQPVCLATLHDHCYQDRNIGVDVEGIVSVRFADVPYEACPGFEEQLQEFRDGNRCNWVGKRETKKKLKTF